MMSAFNTFFSSSQTASSNNEKPAENSISVDKVCNHVCDIYFSSFLCVVF